MERLDDDDLRTLGYGPWSAALEAGIAPHHAGLVPAFRQAVEQCFSEGLLKVVFATETLALGINMPARTVVVERFAKFRGSDTSALTSGEYRQLTGRAGRRGIDTVGHAFVLWSAGTPFPLVARTALAPPPDLVSSFHPTYNLAVNLVRRWSGRRPTGCWPPPTASGRPRRARSRCRPSSTGAWPSWGAGLPRRVADDGPAGCWRRSTTSPTCWSPRPSAPGLFDGLDPAVWPGWSRRSPSRPGGPATTWRPARQVVARLARPGGPGRRAPGRRAPGGPAPDPAPRRRTGPGGDGLGRVPRWTRCCARPTWLRATSSATSASSSTWSASWPSGPGPGHGRVGPSGRGPDKEPAVSLDRTTLGVVADHGAR